MLSKEVNKFNEELYSKTVKTELIIKKANELTIDDNNVYRNAHEQLINKHKKQDYCTHIIIGIIILAIVCFMIYIKFHS